MPNTTRKTPLPKTAPRAQANGAVPSAAVAPAPVPPPKPPPSVLCLPQWAYFVGLVGILVALFASGGLARMHLTGKPLPGCGGGMVISANEGAMLGEAPKSACAALEAHPMGSLGGMWLGIKAIAARTSIVKIDPLDAVWPVSFLGVTYFAAALAAWIVIGFRARRVPPAMVWLTRVGALGSMVYIVAIVGTVIAGKDPCPYCIASHIGNLALWFSLEIGMMKARTLSLGGWKWDRALSPLVAGIAVFAIASGTLGALESQRRERMIAEDQVKADETKRDLDKVIQQARDAAAAAPKQQVPWGADGFRGRWLMGPKETPIRVVMLTDYQCPDCRTYEDRVMRAMDQHKGNISLSVVHYPMCTECNPHVSGTMHANACRAARAAEAAALMARNKASMEGKEEWAAANEMFWKMHVWLFDVKGDFDDAKIKAKVAEFGLDPDAFVKIMDGPGTMKIVRDETIWGEVLGLFYTPMMFVNGVEVRGWRSNLNALNEAVDAVAKANLPPADARNDKPDLIGDKKFKDWKLLARRQIEPALPGHTKSPAGVQPKVQVQVFGDLTEAGMKKVDGILSGLIDQKKAIGYSFRHFPVDTSCNPGVNNKYPNGCLASRAVEGAFQLGGAEAYFAMKDLIFSKADSLNPTVVSMMGGIAGLESAKFEEALNSNAVKEIVAKDVKIGATLVDRFLPSVWVDGKYVERWQDGVLERIIEYAIEHPGE